MTVFLTTLITALQLFAIGRSASLPECGMTFTGNAGVFNSSEWDRATSPSYNGRCTWRISVKSGQKIFLNITEINIYKSEKCVLGWLEVLDGFAPEAPALGKFCGSGKGPLLESTGSQLTVIYQSGPRTNSQIGFKAAYETLCGGDIEVFNNTGFLESPNYPRDYQPNKLCVWRLFAPIGNQVVLRFNSFELEKNDSCPYDKVKVRDGNSLDSPLLATLCGDTIPPPFRSSSNTLLVIFESDSTVQKVGFSATFIKEADTCVTVTHGCDHFCVNTHDGYMCTCDIGYELQPDGKKCEKVCGGNIEIQKPGRIQFLNEPQDYDENKLCVWRLSAPTNYQIELTFKTFELESNCSYDYDVIKIRDGFSLDSPVIPISIGDNLPSPIKSTSNKLIVIFESNSTIQTTKFLATYTKEFDECASVSHGCQHFCTNTLEGFKCACDFGYQLQSNGKNCEKICGGDVEIGGPGQLESTNYLKEFAAKLCVWRLIAPKNHRVLLKLQSLPVRDNTCNYEKVQVRDGNTLDSPIISKFCPGSGPATIRSTSNTMVVSFQPYDSNGYRKFSATYMTESDNCIPKEHGCSHSCVKISETYECTCDVGYELHPDGKQCEMVCGGDIEVYNTGHLEPPQFRDAFHANHFCVWRLSVPTNHQVGLTFESKKVVNPDICEHDDSFNATNPSCNYKIKVRDGNSLDSPLVATICGGNRIKIPPPIRSSSNKLLVIFESYSSLEGPGFLATYSKEYDECASTIHQCQQSCINTPGGYKCACDFGYELQSDGKSCKKVCGGYIEVNNNTGYFESPNYPNEYGLGHRCVWRLSVPEGYRVALKFDSFITEGCADPVHVRDGHSLHSPLIGTYCGTTKPPLIRSTSNKLLVIFTTDGSVNRRGFSATVRKEFDYDCSLVDHGCGHFCVNTKEGYVCGCDIGYELQSDGKKCERVCGGDIEVNNDTRHLETPNFPETYKPNNLCVWRLSAPQTYRVVLKFQSFKIEDHSACAKDKLKVIDGDSLDSPLIAVFCGDMIPSPISSTSNTILVIFESDGTNQKTGFSLTASTKFDECSSIDHGCSHFCVDSSNGFTCACYVGYKLHSDGKKCEIECGGDLQVNDTGILSSPKYPEGYESKKFCMWNLSVPQGYKITLKFDTFEVGTHGSCVDDKVKVIDGDSLFGPVIGVYCGDNTPPAIRSASNKLVVIFESKSTVPSVGFSANYTKEFDKCATVQHQCNQICINTPGGGYECACDPGYKLLPDGKTCKKLCGGYLEINDTGHLQSDNYPSSYTVYNFCVWTLSVPQGYQIALRFQAFHLEAGNNCPFDSVTVRDGDSLDSSAIGIYCGTSLPPPIRSTSNKLLVTFQTDGSNQYEGFLIYAMKVL